MNDFGYFIFSLLLQNEGETPELVPVDNLPDECTASVQAVFTENSSQMILAPRTGNIQVYDLREGTPILAFTIPTQQCTC